MDSLRRIRPRFTPAGRVARRVPVESSGERSPRLRSAERRLASALDQLRSGVPLNWGQVEDDPQMAMLARLQQAGQECRLLPLSEPSAATKAAIVEELGGKLPAPVVKQQKAAAPKSLAGFSENVQVLTQVEENVRLGVNWPLALLRGVIGLAVVALVIWGVGSLLKTLSTPSFGWIEVLRGNEPVVHMGHVLGADAPLCKVVRTQNPLRPGYFLPVESLRDAQADVDYNIPLLPNQITVPTTYTFQVALASVDPCDDNNLKESDTGAMIAIQYEVRRSIVDPNGTANAFGKPSNNKVAISSLSMFALNGQPAYLDASTGSWKEVRVGDVHGVYWRGGPYRDPSGVQWVGDMNVLVAEHKDTVVTIVGAITDGITEDMLTEVAGKIGW